MKRFLSSLLTLIMVIGIFTSVPITASAASVSDLTFTLNADGKSYTLSKADEYTTGDLTIPSKYNKLPVTAIGDNAFRYCSTIISVKIPSSVKSIGNSAFSGCSNLESVNMGNGVIYIGSSAFYNCNLLSDITWSSKIESIGDDAFNSCGIKSITLPETLKAISEYAFAYCKSLNDITIPDSIRSIGSRAFYETAYYNNTGNWENGSLYIGNHIICGNGPIKEGTITIADNAFYSESISDIVIPNSVKTIGNGAFALSDIKSITIGNSVETIGQEAFTYCEYLTEITIPGNVKSIGYQAFKDCENLQTVKISNGLETIGDWVFWNCEQLTNITLPDSIKRIGHEVFCSTPIEDNVKNWDDKTLYVNNHLIKVRDTTSGVLSIKKGTKTIADTAAGWCENITKVIIPDSVVTIGNSSFKACRALETVTLGKNLETLGDQAFAHCTVLKSVKLPSKLKTIGYNAFYTCIAINSMTIPASVTSIGSKAIGFRDQYGTENIVGFIIFGKKGTTAEVYAKNNGFKFVSSPVFKSVENYSSGVKLSWSKATGADGYLVFRKTGSESFKKIAKITKNSTVSYIDKTAKSGVTYTYVIKTYSGSNISANSTELSIKVLSAPKLISVANNNAGIVVKWGKVAGANGYNVYRKIGSGKWNRIAIIKGNSTFAYTDKAVKAGTIYKYTVRAYNGSNLSAYNTAGLSIKRLLTPTLRSVVSAKSGITFKWNKVTGANGYLVYRKTGSGDWVKIATVKGNATVSYLDKTAKKGVTYAYTVKAYYSTSKSYHNDKGLKIKDKY